VAVVDCGDFDEVIANLGVVALYPTHVDVNGRGQGIKTRLYSPKGTQRIALVVIVGYIQTKLCWRNRADDSAWLSSRGDCGAYVCLQDNFQRNLLNWPHMLCLFTGEPKFLSELDTVGQYHWACVLLPVCSEPAHFGALTAAAPIHAV
jgi:hypothetical protein